MDRARRSHQEPDTNAWLPTPADIAKRAAEVRKGWSEAERIRRQYSHCEVTQEEAVAEHYARIVPTVPDDVLFADVTPFEPAIDL